MLDVRIPAELNGPLGKINRAINIPIKDIEQRIDELKPYKDKEIIVICRTQNRSAFALKILKNGDYSAKNVIGGMSAFRK